MSVLPRRVRGVYPLHIYISPPPPAHRVWHIIPSTAKKWPWHSGGLSSGLQSPYSLEPKSLCRVSGQKLLVPPARGLGWLNVFQLWISYTFTVALRDSKLKTPKKSINSSSLKPHHAPWPTRTLPRRIWQTSPRWMKSERPKNIHHLFLMPTF
jgi:hypothetical protein